MGRWRNSTADHGDFSDFTTKVTNTTKGILLWSRGESRGGKVSVADERELKHRTTNGSAQAQALPD